MALLGLTAVVIFKKRDVVVTVQTEKVTRRNLTEIVMANGKIQPVLQVKISAEVSGEIIDLPVKEGQKVNKGDVAGEDQAGLLHRRRQPGQRELQVRAGGQGHGARPICARPKPSSNATRTCSGRSSSPIPRSMK